MQVIQANGLLRSGDRGPTENIQILPLQERGANVIHAIGLARQWIELRGGQY